MSVHTDRSLTSVKNGRVKRLFWVKIVSVVCHRLLRDSRSIFRLFLILCLYRELNQVRIKPLRPNGWKTYHTKYLSPYQKSKNMIKFVNVIFEKTFWRLLYLSRLFKVAENLFKNTWSFFPELLQKLSFTIRQKLII